MCGRFSLGATIRVGRLFDLLTWPETPPRYNIAPSQDVPAVIQNRETGARELSKGGRDDPSNMQWLPKAQHQGKTRRDLREP